MPTMTYRLCPGDVDPGAPLIYMWEIRNGTGELTGRYIGKANGGDRRPTRHYSRNVDRYLRRQPYRNGKHYRRVHVALADATTAGHGITLSYLCNVPAGQNIFDVESRYIREYGCDADDGIGLNGRWKGAPPAAFSAPASTPPAGSDKKEDAAADLEDFVDYVLEAYPGRFRIEATPLRYALYIGKYRILRAKVARGRSTVYLKCVRDPKRGHAPVKSVWDGTVAQLADIIDSELRLFVELHGDPQPAA